MINIKEIREIFREMLQEHKTKQEGMFTKHEKLVLDLISGHQALLKQRLDQLCDSLTLVQIDVEELKESLSFTQNDIDQRFSNINGKSTASGKGTKFNKRGRSYYTNDRTSMGIGNSQKNSGSRRSFKKKQFAIGILGIKEDPQES